MSAANPFESVLRALCLDSGLDMMPQRAVLAGRRLIRFTYKQVMSGQHEVLRIFSRVAGFPDADGELLTRSLVNLGSDADRTATNGERAASRVGDGPSRTR